MMCPFQTFLQASLSLMPQSRIDFLKKQIENNPKESGKSFHKPKASLGPSLSCISLAQSTRTTQAVCTGKEGSGKML